MTSFYVKDLERQISALKKEVANLKEFADIMGKNDSLKISEHLATKYKFVLRISEISKKIEKLEEIVQEIKQKNSSFYSLFFPFLILFDLLVGEQKIIFKKGNVEKQVILKDIPDKVKLQYIFMFLLSLAIVIPFLAKFFLI